MPAADLEKILETVRGNIEAACAKSGRSPDEVEIIAVTKTHGPEVVRDAWECGLSIIGENKVQEAMWKQPESVSGPEWHLIGHLQRNKVRQALSLFTCFHGIDTIPVLEKLDSAAEESGASPRVLLEVNVSGESSKNGFKPEDVEKAVERALSLRRVTLEGFMTMAPFSTDCETARPVFAGLRKLRDKIETSFGIRLPRLSMGMSNDYTVAVEEGATWVRLGTVLFGAREKIKPQRRIDAGDAGESGEGGGFYDRILD